MHKIKRTEMKLFLYYDAINFFNEIRREDLLRLKSLQGEKMEKIACNNSNELFFFF